MSEKNRPRHFAVALPRAHKLFHRQLRTPLLGGHVRYALGKRPAVPFRVFGGVLAFAERHIVHWLENLCAKSLRMLEVCVNIRHVHDDILADLSTARRAELAPLASDYNGSLANEKLG